MANLVAMLRLPSNLKSTQWQILAGPILILLILSMMVLPLPAFILDLLFTFNIALSIMVLLVAMFTQRTLDFAAFPTILLFTTLLRLALNVASTRIILMEGHTGAAAAGKVVEAFGHFLVGGNFAIGIVVFIILVIINFMVITKGAGRIAEVGARFVLDGMPGKQMAIDADLNAGLIGEDEAKKRRSEVTQEADFYGSMDGASKFVRGDAIAGILIMVINVVGGAAGRRIAARNEHRQRGGKLHPADHWRRPGRPDPGAGYLHGGGRHCDPRQYRSGCRRADGWPTVQ